MTRHKSANQVCACGCGEFIRGSHRAKYSLGHNPETNIQAEAQKRAASQIRRPKEWTELRKLGIVK